jgi:hypothetical protein
MRREHLFVYAVLTTFIIVIGLGYRGVSRGEKEANEDIGIPPEVVADYVHAVIEADRTSYTKHVERLQDEGIVQSEEDWKHRKALPLPAQLLQQAGTQVSERGGGIQYRLASLWPIYPRNGPATDFEQEGLEAVVKDPRLPHVVLLKAGHRLIFRAVYADKAVSKACVSCHNSHPSSPRKDFKLNDVMGGIIISFPVEEKD